MQRLTFGLEIPCSMCVMDMCMCICLSRAMYGNTETQITHAMAYGLAENSLLPVHAECLRDKQWALIMIVIQHAGSMRSGVCITRLATLKHYKCVKDKGWMFRIQRGMLFSCERIHYNLCAAYLYTW